MIPCDDSLVLGCVPADGHSCEAVLDLFLSHLFWQRIFSLPVCRFSDPLSESLFPSLFHFPLCAPQGVSHLTYRSKTRQSLEQFQVAKCVFSSYFLTLSYRRDMSLRQIQTLSTFQPQICVTFCYFCFCKIISI